LADLNPKAPENSHTSKPSPLKEMSAKWYHIHFGSRARGALKGIASLATLAASLFVVGASLAAPPDWWAAHGVIDSSRAANDFAAVNQGQLKCLAKGAYLEMEANFADGGAGESLDSVIASWSIANPARNDFAAVNLGQVKTLAKPFYDRLIELELATGYPWADSAAPANDFALANTGQVKNLFGFDIPEVGAVVDSDGDGLPDEWELAFGLNPNDPGDAILDGDGDGLSAHDEFSAGSSPLLADTDGDGLNDGYEVATDRDPSQSNLQISLPGSSGLRVHSPVRRPVRL